jgi:hypothetical protein
MNSLRRYAEQQSFAPAAGQRVGAMELDVSCVEALNAMVERLVGIGDSDGVVHSRLKALIVCRDLPPTPGHGAYPVVGRDVDRRIRVDPGALDMRLALRNAAVVVSDEMIPRGHLGQAVVHLNTS